MVVKDRKFIKLELKIVLKQSPCDMKLLIYIRDTLNIGKVTTDIKRDLIMWRVGKTELQTTLVPLMLQYNLFF